MALTTVRITSRYIGMDGEPCSGTVTFTPPCVVRDNDGHAIISGPITAELDFMGYLDAEVPCDQDALDPSGFTWLVTERLDCSDCLTQYRISVPCEDMPPPTPIPAAVAVCAGDGYTVGVAAENVIYPVTVDWGDGTTEVFDSGPMTHTYYRDGDRLDPTRPATAIWPAPAGSSQGSAWQGLDMDPLTGEWYGSGVMAAGQTLEGETSPASSTQRRCAGDMAIDHLTADGQQIAHMYARKFDHGAGFSVQRDGDTLYLWTGTDAQDCSEGDGKIGYATKVGRYTFVADSVLDVGDPGLEIFDPFPNYTNVTPDIDATHGTIAIRYYLQEEPGQPRNKITVWTIEDFLARDFSNPVYDVAAPYHPDGQSWTHYGHYSYAYHGGTNKPQYFYILDLETGDEIGPIENTQQMDWPSREAEVIKVRETGEGPQIVWAMAVRPDPDSGLVTVAFAGEPYRTAQDVTITVTDAAGTVVPATGIDHIPCTE